MLRRLQQVAVSSAEQLQGSCRRSEGQLFSPKRLPMSANAMAVKLAGQWLPQPEAVAQLAYSSFHCTGKGLSHQAVHAQHASPTKLSTRQRAGLKYNENNNKYACPFCR